MYLLALHGSLVTFVASPAPFKLSLPWDMRDVVGRGGFARGSQFLTSDCLYLFNKCHFCTTGDLGGDG